MTELRQQIDEGFHIPLGSLVYEKDAGFDWLNEVFGKHTTKEGREAAVRRYILKHPKVDEVNVTERVDRRSRKVFIKWKAKTKVGLVTGELELEQA